MPVWLPDLCKDAASNFLVDVTSKTNLDQLHSFGMTPARSFVLKRYLRKLQPGPLRQFLEASRTTNVPACALILNIAAEFIAQVPNRICSEQSVNNHEHTQLDEDNSVTVGFHRRLS